MSCLLGSLPPDLLKLNELDYLLIIAPDMNITGATKSLQDDIEDSESDDLPLGTPVLRTSVKIEVVESTGRKSYSVHYHDY